MAPTTKGATRRTLVDATGRKVTLGRELGRGAEGSVFDVEGAPDLAAKLYHMAPDQELAAKLVAVARATSPVLTAVAAWPTSTLHDAQGGPATGLLMPRVAGAEVHCVYSPAHRKAEFPTYDWGKLIVVARNIAAAVARIHDAGHVIGDVNEKNVLVGPAGMVWLIDCDSFQIKDGATRRLCKVGVPHYTPPELQGGSFRGIVRTQNHDAFGLAVLLFRLLFMGRHPFAGRYSGKGEMPIEQAITDFRFAFGRQAGQKQMAPPPNALPLASASPLLADLFERAFGPDGAQSNGRPTAGQWVVALDTLRSELTTCTASRGHRYHTSLGTQCPWCAIERAGGPDFFASVLASFRATAGGFDLQAVWAAITAVPAPERVPGLPVASNAPTPPSQPVSRVRRVAWRVHRLGTWVAGVAAAVAVFGSGSVAGASLLTLIVSGAVAFVLRRVADLSDERTKRQQAAREARMAVEHVEAQWRRETSAAADQFAARRRELESLRTEYLALDSKKRDERQRLDAQRRERQKQQFLERFFIDKAELKGIGPGLKATLASYGIETAADVDPQRVLAVPGFGPARVSALCAWRDQMAMRFAYDPSKGIDPADLASLDRKYARRRQEIEQILSTGASDLRRLYGAAEQVRKRLGPTVTGRRAALAVAEANLAAVK